MKTTPFYSLCAAIGAVALLAGPVLRADDLILNGGFEGDPAYTGPVAGPGSVTSYNTGVPLTYESSVGGYTNTSVPVDWIANNAFDAIPGFNHVNTGNQWAGSYDLSISNYDYDVDAYGAPAELSQTFADVAGANYEVSFYAYDGGANGDSNAYLSASVGPASVTLNDTVSTWTLESFSFTGTGLDTLTIAAQTNPSEWYVDNVSVTGSPVVNAPDQVSAAVLLGVGLAALGVSQRRLSRVRALR